ncbi:hypothetical protein [Marinobacter sp. W-8]|uniref:hypothetical protein n=1 Tax=Marinobacter sp. W-8 TaxID=3369658 RepID=UPI0037C644C5
MKQQSPVKPGWFFRNGRRYLAVSEVPRTVNLTTSEVTDAISLGQLRIERVNGCKVVAMEELFNWIDMQESGRGQA